MNRARIFTLLGGPELARVFAAARRALEARGAEKARSITLIGLSAAERKALADLQGWSQVPSGERVKVELEALDASLAGSAVGLGLEGVLVVLGGPLVDRKGARLQARHARERLWTQVREHPAIRGRPELGPWLERLRAQGLVARVARVSGASEEIVLDRALAVIERLPASGVLLPVLATEVLGDAHALDVGSALTRIIIGAAAALAGWSSLPASALERRMLWAEVGVACDSISTDVLTLGLRPQGDGLLARHLREASAQGVPRRITLRELMQAPIGGRRTETVFVCENPSVVLAAADRLGGNCPPLVCLEGVPSTAAIRLLRALDVGGAALRFHADLDWAGVGICNRLMEELPNARPWRMGASDYERAVGEGGERLELSGGRLVARWDSELAGALERNGVAVLEEGVMAELLADLESG